MAKRGGFPGGMPGNMNNLMKQAQCYIIPIEQVIFTVSFYLFRHFARFSKN